MASLTHQRCLNHLQREAVARCTGCRQFFCRECISEHEHRVLCANCLRQAAAAKPGRTNRLAPFVRATEWLAGLALAWFFFYLVGECLLALPTSFHDGTVWEFNATGHR
jgi:hypothetical protein